MNRSKVMKRGKHICDTLKQIRLDIARANGIEYAPRECHHEGDCAGTCPACESEMRYLEREIARRSMGRVALVAGVSLGLMSFTATSCSRVEKGVKEILHHSDDHVLQGEVELVDDSCDVNDSVQNSSLKDSISGRDNAAKKKDVPRLTELPIVGEVDSVASSPPSFPGGQGALLKYIMDNFQYPPSSAAEIRAFKINVQFYVDEHGKVGDVKILRSVDQYFDSEMIRVIKSLPEFMPGRNADNEPVGSWYTLPINFKVQEGL